MGSRRIILMPGMDGSGALFDKLVRLAPPSVVPLVVRYASATTYEDIGRIVQQELDGHSAPAVLIAESFAGPAALRVAAHQPHRVAAVILCNSFVVTPRRLVPLLPWALLFRLPLPNAVLRYLFVGAHAPSELLAELKRSIAAAGPSVLTKRLQAINNLGRIPPAMAVEAPVLYLRGANDRLVPESAVGYVQKAVPQLAVERMPGPHLLLQTNPEEAWSRICRFLARAG